MMLAALSFAAPVITAAVGRSTGAELSVVQDPPAPGASYRIVAFSAAGCAAGDKVDEAPSSSTVGTGATGAPFQLPYGRTTAGELWFQVVVSLGGNSATSTTCLGPVVVGEGLGGFWRMALPRRRVLLAGCLPGWLAEAAACCPRCPASPQAPRLRPRWPALPAAPPAPAWVGTPWREPPSTR